MRILKSVITMIILLTSIITNGQVKVEYYNHWDEVTKTLEYNIVQFKPNSGDRRMYIRIDGEEHDHLIQRFPSNPLFDDLPEPTWITYVCYQGSVYQPTIFIDFNLKENKARFRYNDGSYAIYSGLGLKYTVVY